MERMEEEEIYNTKFRVSCVLCNHGTGMTIEEIQKQQMWPYRPYIEIPYCKYCYTDNAMGLFDDQPELLGWRIKLPNRKRETFHLSPIEDDFFEEILEKNARK